jgi:hypothetical protein
MASSPIRGFFAYPSSPRGVCDAVHSATQQLNTSGLVQIQLWEELRIGGKLVIHEITKAIDSSQLFFADLTGMNANVMFELGYAITKKKRIWLVLDATYTDAKRTFDQFKLLTTIGYRSSSNSRDLVRDYYIDRPHEDLTNSIFASIVDQQLRSDPRESLFYLRPMHENEAGIHVTKRVTARLRSGLVQDDPSEASFQTLAMYAQHMHSSCAVLCHLSSAEREGTRVHIARQAFVCGMAHGLGKQLLILTEGDHLAPLDYRDLSVHYQNAKSALSQLEGWLVPIEEHLLQQYAAPPSYPARSTVRDLRSLRLGEYVAENEKDSLVDDYFVDTSSYREAYAGNHAIFVGRKGSGKTANFYKLASELSKDRANLVCVIKPPAYQLHGILDLFNRFTEQDTKGFLIESIWKFLLLTELAIAAVTKIKNRLASPVSEEERDLLELSTKHLVFQQDFSVRLEQTVDGLIQLHKKRGAKDSKEKTRLAISESLHQGMLKDLRISLGKALYKSKRVAILVDNLDKAWEKESSIPELGKFLLGLLTVAGRLPDDLRHEDSRRMGISASLAVFLRSDIFYKIIRVAREPDKIRFHKLTWSDPELLLRVIEERFAASRQDGTDPKAFWNTYFCATVGGKAVSTYLVQHIVPRPRDLVFFVRAAVDTAVNRGHSHVAEQDILDAEKQYSQYAFESILVENGVSVRTLENLLLEFAGSRSVLPEEDLREIIDKAIPTPETSVERMVEHLCSLTFLGVEASDNDFRFTDDPEALKKNMILGKKLAETRGRTIHFRINPAFRAYLEVRE